MSREVEPWLEALFEEYTTLVVNTSESLRKIWQTRRTITKLENDVKLLFSNGIIEDPVDEGERPETD